MSHALAMDLVWLASSGLAFAVVAELWQKRAALQRMQTVLGAGGPAFSRETFDATMAWLAVRLPQRSDPALRALLARAGYHQPWAMTAFVLLRLLCMAGAFGLGLSQQKSLTDPVSFLPTLFMAFFCGRLLIILLKLRGESRQWEIRRELPPVIDILLMVLNSGASIDQSLRYVSGVLDSSAPIVGAVLRRCLADVDSGVPYETAFERLGQRLGIEEGHDLAALIMQALLQGGEIVGTLERFGAELAEKRVTAAREQIGRKATQLTMVMLLFFMPVLMVILAGPAVSNIFETLGTVKLHAAQIRGGHS
jgi:tight adherence protein C